MANPTGRKLLFFIPLTAFLGLSLFLLSGLFSDPWQHDSALLKKPLPEFSLPDLANQQQLVQKADLLGKPFLLNVWGLWCVTCDAELGFMTQLRQQGVNIVGLYYVQPVDASFGERFEFAQLQKDVAKRLAQRGDPYARNIVDEHRQFIFDLGVTGAPETFLVDPQGNIQHHLVGDLNANNWPELSEKYRALDVAGDQDGQ